MTRPRTGLPYLDAGREQGTVLALAHRGGARHPDLAGLENTLAAFEHATALGYTYLETDVHATRDGVLLAFHDLVLDRLTDRSGGIGDATYDELAGPLVGGREPIPTMADLLERLPDARFNIDVKSDRATDLLAALVERLGAHDRVCVGAFSERRLRRFRRGVRRRVATSFGPVGVGVGRIARTPLAQRVLGAAGDAYQVPVRTRGVRIVTPRFVERAHAAGHPVHVWTVDDPPQMHALLDLGVDGLISDRTDLLKEVLVDRGQWWEPGR